MLAVFDLDGTLLDGDSTALWLWSRVRRFVPRLLATLIVAPIAIPMVIAPRTRRAGASILLWIATVGLDERGLHESCTLSPLVSRRAPCPSAGADKGSRPWKVTSPVATRWWWSPRRQPSWPNP